MPEEKTIGRRGFVAGAAGAACMLALGGVKFLPEKDFCRPPGAQDEDRFIGACIRCGKCLEVCPTGAIVPAPIEDGILSVRTPKMNFARTASDLNGMMGWCDHCAEKNGGVAKCASVCPSGALSLEDDSTFDTMRLGVAEITTDWCLAWLLKGCTLCKNACPRDAIYFDSVNRPYVDADLCNGCGSCEQACVSLESVSFGSGNRSADTRAIHVNPVSKG